MFGRLSADGASGSCLSFARGINHAGYQAFSVATDSWSRIVTSDLSARLAEALERYRECVYDAAHARNDRERQALEAQADLCLKVVMELQEQVNQQDAAVGAA